MTDEQRAELKRLAQAATSGEWYVGDKQGWQVYDGRFIRTSLDKSGTALVVSTGDNAAFIAAANPEAVLGLLAEVERLRAALERARIAHGLTMFCNEAEDCDGLPQSARDGDCECGAISHNAAITEALKEKA